MKYGTSALITIEVREAASNVKAADYAGCQMENDGKWRAFLCGCWSVPIVFYARTAPATNPIHFAIGNVINLNFYTLLFTINLLKLASHLDEQVSQCCQINWLARHHCINSIFRCYCFQRLSASTAILISRTCVYYRLLIIMTVSLNDALWEIVFGHGSRCKWRIRNRSPFGTKDPDIPTQCSGGVLYNAWSSSATF